LVGGPFFAKASRCEQLAFAYFAIFDVVARCTCVVARARCGDVSKTVGKQIAALTLIADALYAFAQRARSIVEVRSIRAIYKRASRLLCCARSWEALRGDLERRHSIVLINVIVLANCNVVGVCASARSSFHNIRIAETASSLNIVNIVVADAIYATFFR